MKQFLMGAAVATAVLGAAGFAVLKEPVADAALKKTVPLKLSDLTLDRAFRFTASVGPSGTISVPTIVPFPASTGVVITSIRGHFGFSGYVSLGVDGFEAERVTVSSENGHTGIIDPPLVVRPGSVLSVGQSWNNGMFPVTLAGYFVYPGEV